MAASVSLDEMLAMAHLSTPAELIEHLGIFHRYRKRMDAKRFNLVLLAVYQLHRQSGSPWRMEHDVVTQSIRLSHGLEHMVSLSLRGDLPSGKEHETDEQLARDAYTQLLALQTSA